MHLSDCYRLLGLRTGASYDEIKASYRRLARQYHPDVNPGEAQQAAQEKFIQLTEAYEKLLEISQTPAMRQAQRLSRPPGSARKQQSWASQASPRQNSQTGAQSSAATGQSSNSQSSAQSRRAASQAPKESPPPRIETPPPRTVTQTTETKAATQASDPATLERKKPTIQRDPSASQTDHQLKVNAYEQLQLLIQERRFPRAIALVEGLSQRLPNDREVRNWLAIAYYKWGCYLIGTGDPDKARLYLNKAIRTAPDYKELWYEVDRAMQRLDIDFL